MGLRAVRPSTAIVKVMSVLDSRCVRVVTPDDHVNIGFHAILLHDMGEEVLPFVAMCELDYLRRIWPRALFVFMSRYQQDLECLTYQGRDCIMDFSAGGTLSPSVSDLSGPRGHIVLPVGLWPEVAVPLPAMWDPLFASLLVELLKMTGADVVGRSRAVHGGWSGPDVAGISAVVDLGAASDRAVECLARDGGGRHDMVDDRPIYELTSYEL